MLSRTVAVIILTASLGASAQPASRSFRLGFTGFPHDFTLPAILEARAFCRDNGDIIAHHIEGVPWAECLNSQPFSAKLLEDWNGKTKATAKNGKVYLAISPGRGELKVHEKSLPLPKELAGKRYDDPLVMKTYLAYCRRAVEFFKPDYLCIGIEVNDLFKGGAQQWSAYKTLHEYVYAELKKDHKDLPIFASFTLHNLLNAGTRDRRRMLAAFAEIMPHNDLVAVSFYPFIRGGTTDYAGCLQSLADAFAQYNKPFAFVETGEAAERFQFPTSKQVIDGTPEKQEAYFKALLPFAGTHRTEFIICFVHRDYDLLWDKMKAGAPEAFAAWRDCGLIDEAGNPRPAFKVWKAWFDLPYKPR